MKKLFETLFAPFKSQLEVNVDWKALADFVLWFFNRMPMAEIAERLDPVFKGKALFEKIDDFLILEWLKDAKKWAEEKVK